MGYYYVVTDATKTEPNYLRGFKESLPASARDKIEIHVETAATDKMLDNCIDACAMEPQHRIPWIVFDRDRVPGFDRIIEQAERLEVNVAWSNPCIEVWLGAYFGKVISKAESKQCVLEFGRLFESKVNQEYSKSDPRLYDKLSRFGNEAEAIKIIAGRHQSAWKDCGKPSEMCPCSTMYQLIQEIRDKASE